MNKGAGCLMIGFALLFFILLSRFLYLQVIGTVHGESLKKWGTAKYNQNGVLEAMRGTIYDSRGEVLAQDVPAYKLVAILKGDKSVKDKEMTAEKLAPVLNQSKDSILQKLNKDAVQTEFGPAGNNITQKQRDQIMDMNLPGIQFVDGTARIYPNGDFASYVLGYAKPNDLNVLEGQFGLEKSLDSYLHAQNGTVSFDKNASGFSNQKITPPKNGDNVYLTIDQHIQSFLEDEMKKAYDQYKPSMLVGIIVDPKTGKTLAMSSKPSFDPNNRDISYFLNDPIAYAYEPGSTFKMFTLAAAINEGVYNGQEYYQSGTYKVGNSIIKDHNDGAGWGSITFDEGVQRSSNVAFSILAEQKLGYDRFRDYIHKFHLDQPTGIDLPGEGKNTILFDKPIQKATTAFGQGSTVTPIQQVQAATAIANDGQMMKPYVIDHIVDPDTNQIIEQHNPEIVDKPITKETAQKERALLETVITSPKGTGTMYKIDGYPVAGKTGTAQIPGPDGHYMVGKENYIFSFMGMAPASDPKLLCYLAIKQPKLKDTDYGSTPLATIFTSVMKNSLQYLKIKESAVADPQSLAKQENVSTPNVVGQNMDNAKAMLEKVGLQAVVLGQGNVTSQMLHAGDTALKGDRVILAGNDNKMPNIVGWSMRDAMNLANVLGLNLKTDGQGYVTDQSIKEGTPVKNGDSLELKLAPPLEISPGTSPNPPSNH
ncbi:penicillin-binding transpeptidase domain-containing protein [Ectobacillus polymachus]|uniref:penicillin-binding transpeptidase domain-containing protein n=1 Tax=Ectobacillus polymachus TaxID=1508806 RepID=UPI003A842CD9